jgi:hypothetical protein
LSAVACLFTAGWIAGAACGGSPDFGAARAADAPAPLPAKRTYDARILPVADGKPGAFVVGFFDKDGRLFEGRVYGSLTSPALKTWVATLPAGATLTFVDDTSVRFRSGPPPRLDTRELEAACKKVGVEFSVLIACG